MSIPRVVHSYDVTYGDCRCLSCLLAVYMNNVVYGTQKLASADVMAEYPSPSYRPAGQPSLLGSTAPSPTTPPPPYEASHAETPPPPPVPTTTATAEDDADVQPIDMPPPVTALAAPLRPQLTTCPMYDTYGWCLYGSTCLLEHRQLPLGCGFPLIQAAATVEEALERLFEMGQRHMATEYWHCDVCGFEGVAPTHMAKVGETYSYRYCVECTTACYLPCVLNLVEALIKAVGDDYQLYKDTVERFRKQLPELLKIPFSYEAHRIATTVFAWSLFTPQDAKMALETAGKFLGDQFSIVASVGCGTGYVEHVLNRVANGVAAVPHGPSIRGPDGMPLPSSFEGVRAALSNSPISFFAFDEIIRPVRFSVAVLNGAPNVLSSLDCPRAALLLCWPPFGSPEEEQSSMGFEALRYFYNRGGKVVIYVGDVSSTGDWRFHSLLPRLYHLSRDYYVRHEVRRWLPQEMGLVYAGCDTIGVYVRRDDGPIYC